MTELTISLKGLGAFHLSRVGYSSIYVEVLTRGVLAHAWRVTVDATIVARRATLGRTVPLFSKLPTSISGETKATSLKRQAEFMP